MASNLRVDSIVPATGTNVSIGTATGGVNIPGVLTYEDVTNVDSVGVITARSGIRIGATGANTLITGNGVGIGIGITTPQEELHIRAATPVIRLEDGDNARQSQIVGSDGNLRLDADNGNAIADTNIAFRTDGGERLRIGPVGQIGIGGANYGTSGQVLTSQGASSAVQWATPSSGKFASYAVVCDQKANNTDGGTFSNGAWRTRDLNREVCDDDGIVTVANNKFTLGSGTYFIRWSAPAAFCGRHQSKLHNDTDNQTLEYGNNCFADNGNNGMNNSMGSARVTIGATKNFEIRHQCATSVGGDGYGVGNNFGGVCIYTVVEIFKQN